MQYFVRKTGILLLTLFVISVVTFWLFHIVPGDPAAMMLGTSASEKQLKDLREELGLDRPLTEQYTDWIGGAVHGDLGTSINYKKPVAELLKGKLSITLILGAMALALVILIGIPLGVFTAGRRHVYSEQLLNILNIFGISIPGFFLSILLIWIFGLLLHFFTPGRFITWERDPVGFFRSMIFPAIAIAIPQTCILCKYIRTAVVDEVRADYVRTARSKGSTKNRILYVHVLKNAIVSVVPLIGMIVSGIFSGSIVIEQVFGIPGIGRLLIASVTSRDYPTVQTLVMYIAILILIVNFVVDILIQILDPRIRIAK
ncbi:MAG: ABC transporter permease [Eubacteriales bacterium]|nr:ABC transporter permease [Sarcina sp.]MBR2730234.1 ABC transporter permease [Lachnospiraceae bacterium]MDO4417530.1 ABC transporter permease [Eubacteriales bacterium]